jgi:hypothetical protein
MGGNERRQVLYAVLFRSKPGIREVILWLVSLNGQQLGCGRRQKAEEKSSSTNNGEKTRGIAILSTRREKIQIKRGTKAQQRRMHFPDVPFSKAD